MSPHLRLVQAQDKPRASELESTLQRTLGSLEARLDKALHTELRALEERSSDMAEGINKLLAILGQPKRTVVRETDDYGYEAAFAERLRFLFGRFRLTLPTGRAMLFTDRAWKQLLLCHYARPLLEAALMQAPILGVQLNRLGAVLACKENMLRMLGEDRVLVATPTPIAVLACMHSETSMYRLHFDRFDVALSAPVVCKRDDVISVQRAVDQLR